MTDTTTMKITKEQRDRLRACRRPGETLSDTLVRGLLLVEREEFRAQVAKIELDEDYWAEAQPWLDADLTSPAPPRPHA